MTSFSAGQYWRVMNPDFLKPGNYSINKHKEIVELLSNDGKLIKRPFLVINESKLILGFKEPEYIANFK